MNMVDILNAMGGVAVAEIAAKRAMESDGTFILYRTALAGAELVGEIMMTQNAGELLALVIDGDQSEAFDRVLVYAERMFDELDRDFEIVV